MNQAPLEKRVRADTLAYYRPGPMVNLTISRYGAHVLLRMSKRDIMYVMDVSFLYGIVPRGDGRLRQYLREGLDQ